MVHPPSIDIAPLIVREPGACQTSGQQRLYMEAIVDWIVTVSPLESFVTRPDTVVNSVGINVVGLVGSKS